MTALKELIQSISALKPMPKIAGQIMTLVEQKRSLSEIAGLIRFDPILTANLLQTCNSAYFSLPRKVDSVRDAVSLLGLDQIVDMVLLKCGAGNLSGKQAGYGLDEGELWRQSVAAALIARDLAEKRPPAGKHLVFTAALLKDVGKVILDQFVADGYARIHKLVETKGLSFREAEKKVIGVDHAELGGLVAQKWRFSGRMIDLIRNHHMTGPAARQDLETGIVYLADTVCMMMGIGVGNDGLAYRFHRDVMNFLGFSALDLQKQMAVCSEKLQQIEALIT